MNYSEVRFLSIISSNKHYTPNELISIPEFPFSRDVAEYYLQKWHDKGWYTYSETLGEGKLTEEGLKHAGSVGILTKDDD